MQGVFDVVEDAEAKEETNSNGHQNQQDISRSSGNTSQNSSQEDGDKWAACKQGEVEA